MGAQAQKLRDLFDSGEHFFAADAYSALTGRIVELVGFKAAYLGGHACSAFHYAVPDNGIYSQVEQIEQAGRIAAAIDIPLIADADTLGETVADAYHFIRRYERAGIAGIHVEDETNPKHSSYANGLVPIEEMQARIEACVKARSDKAFMIIARCDEVYVSARGGGGTGSVEMAIKRGQAYAEAGADALVYPHMRVEMVPEFKRALSVPLVALGMQLPDTACTLHTGWGWLGAAQHHLACARELYETGKVTMNHNFDEKNILIGQDVYDRLIADWASKTGRPVR
jgi:2-methylisocitrate lyase-like PEP mutase family enzyme